MLELTREGGHLRRRIAHAGGDATGAEVSRALLRALAEAGAGADEGVGIDVIEHAMSLDLLLAGDGGVAGLTLHVIGEGQQDGVGAVHAPAVVLATGGMGQVYSATTNPPVSTGDGVGLALRAGAEAADLEFVQFHPTVLWLGAGARGRQPLISEAVRGEGAFLIDGAGRRFMTGRHPLADLAPRDVVAKAIMNVMAETGTDHVYLDGTHLGEDVWEHRFPTIRASCLSHGIDPVREPIPVVPAAHYASGGVKTDLHGRTSIAWPVRLRRGRMHRRPRREPPRLELPARGPRLRRAHRRGPRVGSPAAQAARSRRPAPAACSTLARSTRSSTS